MLGYSGGGGYGSTGSGGGDGGSNGSDGQTGVFGVGGAGSGVQIDTIPLMSFVLRYASVTISQHKEFLQIFTTRFFK